MADIGGRRQVTDTVFEEIVPSAAWTEDSSCHYLLVDLPGIKKEWLNLQVYDHGRITIGGEIQSENKIVHFEQTYKLPENSDTEKISGRYEGEILYVIVPKQVKEEERAPPNATTDNSAEEDEHQHDQAEHGEKHQHEHTPEEHSGGGHIGHHDQAEHSQKHQHEHTQEELSGGGHIGHHDQNDDNNKVVEEADFQQEPRETWRLEGDLLRSVVEILSKNKRIVAIAVLAFSLGVLCSQKFQTKWGTEGGLSPM